MSTTVATPTDKRRNAESTQEYWLNRICDTLDVIDLGDCSTAQLSFLTVAVESANSQEVATTANLTFWRNRAAAVLHSTDFGELPCPQVAALALLLETFAASMRPVLRLVPTATDITDD